MHERLDDAYLARREEDDSPTTLFLRDQAEAAEAEAATKIGEPKSKPTPDAPKPSGGVVKDIGRGLAEAPLQVLGGIRDATVEAGQAIESLADFVFSKKMGLPKGPRLTVNLPKPGEAETTTGGLVRSAAQFLTGFVPFLKAAKVARVGGAITRGAVAGAATDFAVFDPSEPRVSNMLGQLAPALRNPITDYLAADPNDTEAEGRLKNAIEGLALGGTTDAILRAAKAMKLSRLARKVERAEAKATALIDEPEFPKMPASPRRLEPEPVIAPSPPRGVLLTSEEIKATAARFDRLSEQEIREAAGLSGKKLDDLFRQWADETERLRALKRPMADPETNRANQFASLYQDLGVRASQMRAALPDVDTIDSLSRRYLADVERQRRGTRTHAQAASEAAASGMKLDDVRTIMPGTAMNDAEAVAVVNVLVDSGRKLKGLAAGAKSGDATATRAFLEQIYLHAQIDPKRLGVMAEAGRTLSVLNEPVSGMNRFLKQFEQLFQDSTRGMTPQRLASMIDAFETPEQLTVFARQIAKPSGVDMVMEAWINGLLSGPQTHLVNTLSNAATAFWALPERALAARMGGGGVAHGEATQLMFGMLGSLSDAFQLSWHAMRTGQRSTGLQKIESRRKAITAEALEATGPMGVAVDALGDLIRLPGNILVGTDEFFKLINYRGELRAHAWREANAVVAAEGLTGPAKSLRLARLTREIMNDPPARIRDAAEGFAAYRTFTKELGEAGGYISKALDAHPGLRVVMPFFRTPVNLAKYALERTPLAFVADAPGLRSLMPEMAANLRAGGSRRQLALAQASLGSAVMAMGGAMAMSGVITGGGPSDPSVRREWLQNNQPYSIKIGNKWVSYNRLEPAGMILGLAADTALVLGGTPDDDKDGLAMALTLAVAKNITSKTYLRGIASAVNALSDPERYSGNFLRQLAGSAMPFSSAVATAERVVDPTLRDARTALDQWMSRIPGLSTQVKPRVDRWGEDVKPGGTGWWVVDAANPFYIKDVGQDPVSDEIVRLRMSLDLAPDRIGEIALTDEQLYRYRKLDGKEIEIGNVSLKERLQTVMASSTYERMSDDARKARISDWVARYRDRARDRLLDEFPELKDKVRAAEGTRRRIFERPAPQPSVLSITGSLNR